MDMILKTTDCKKFKGKAVTINLQELPGMLSVESKKGLGIWNYDFEND